eukprot:jgi/Chrzof1/10421/UNPLg00347.t1
MEALLYYCCCSAASKGLGIQPLWNPLSGWDATTSWLSRTSVCLLRLATHICSCQRTTGTGAMHPYISITTCAPYSFILNLTPQCQELELNAS